jgi:predicted nucleic acid-binding protein
MKVLDSDFLIALLRKNPEVRPKLDELAEAGEPLATTVFNAQEVFYGAMLSGRQVNIDATKRLLETTNILIYNMEGMHRVMEIKSYLGKHGTPIGVFDEMVAGICVAAGATIVTRNVRHFGKVPGLRVEEW